MKLASIFNSVLSESANTSNEPKLSPTEKEVLTFIMGNTLDEGGDEIINRLLSLIDSGKKNLITAAVVATLMGSSVFSQALAQSPPAVKSKIENTLTSLNKQNANQGSSKEISTGKIKLNNSMYTDSFSNNFSSGSFDLQSTDINSQLSNLKEFLLKNSNNDYEIKITASESLVPNQGGMKKGELASKRAKTLTSIIQQFLSANNLNNIKVTPQIRVGDVAWDGVNKDDSKYTKDQFVQMDVIAIKGDQTKKGFTKDGAQGSEDANYVDSSEQLKGNGEVTLAPGWIPDRLVVYKDGKIIEDTGYFVDKKMTSQYEQWNFTPLHIASLTNMLTNSPDTDATKVNTIKTFENFNELIQFMLKAKNYNYKLDSRREIKEGLLELQKMWESGQRQFMFYSAKSGKVEFKFNPGEQGELKVFSPANDTEYSYSGYQMVNGARVSLEKNK